MGVCARTPSGSAAPAASAAVLTRNCLRRPGSFDMDFPVGVFTILLPDGQQTIAVRSRVEAGAAQSFRDFIRNVPPARQLVRCAGVVEQPAAALQDSGELFIEGLRVELSGDAEARRVVQDRVERAGGY